MAIIIFAVAVVELAIAAVVVVVDNEGDVAVVVGGCDGNVVDSWALAIANFALHTCRNNAAHMYDIYIIRYSIYFFFFVSFLCKGLLKKWHKNKII